MTSFPNWRCLFENIRTELAGLGGRNSPRPPRSSLSVIERARSAYKAWIPIRRTMHRTERFGIGKKIDDLFLELLELLRQAEYLAPEPKIVLLGNVALVIDALRFFLQLAWDIDLIHDTPYANLGQMIEEVGRMTGGWKRGLIEKLTRLKAGLER